ncbi:MAG: FAD-dependent oxidoreductase [Ruminococcaceae bacterium]|nr:FAD-dependent oxidoreductase [Oscillospiraceae bacterium]
MIPYTDGKIMAKEQEIPVIGEYDVIVAGGGVAGCAAAMAVGKRGYRVLLIEATSALGGLVTMGLVNIPLDFISGLGREMIKELEAVNGFWHRNSDPEKHKLVLDRMIKKYNVEVLLVTQIVDAITDGDVIRGAVIQTKSGRRAVLAKRFIDASGDSDLAYYAGAETVSGRPEDGMSQACSLEFTLGGVNWEAYVTSDLKKNDPKWVKTIREDLKSGLLPYESDNHLNWMTHIPGRPQNCGMDEVSICFVHSRNCYPLDPNDLTRMYFEGRDQSHMLAEYIKKRIPGFENSFLTATASLLGVRESRRIVGEYTLTARDLAFSRKHDDVVTISNHGYDIHNFDDTGNIKWAPIEIDGEIQYVISTASGFGTTTPPPDGKPVVNCKGQTAEYAEFEPGLYYDIPYRCLVPVKLENLLVAGRNLSSDVYAQSGARLIMACFTMGEAAGTATCISLKNDITPRQVDRVELQQELIDNNVNIGQGFRDIPGVTDKTDYADAYANGEYRKEKVIRENVGNEFTLQSKFSAK